MSKRAKYSAFTDTELISFLRKDDSLAFNEIYDRYMQYAYRAAYNILQDEDVCLDIVQDIFVWLWQKRASLEIPNLKSYLYTATKYRMLNEIRDGRFRQDVLTQMALVTNRTTFDGCELELKELKRFIEQITKTLPVAAREIFTLSRQEQLSHREIAERLNLSEKTVRNQINISLKRIRLSFTRFVIVLFSLLLIAPF